MGYFLSRIKIYNKYLQKLEMTSLSYAMSKIAVYVEDGNGDPVACAKRCLQLIRSFYQ